MDEYIGKILDNRYEILERIGTGGMAVVYKALCHRLNRMVAVKILKPELAKDAEFRRRFHDESQAVAMLSHPNIVAVYDVSHTDELNYIVMELIDGITLKQYMQKKGGALNWKEATHFMIQIMKGLSHAHSRGIIHRDIKPHNIMVLRDGSVKVADFGIARLASASQATLTQETLGSVHYISPEQARGSHIDCRTDIYSAGVVLYEMTTGRLPYEGDTPVSVAIQHINSIPLPTRDINPDIPEALEAITMKAMASNVDKRYPTADAMLADLEEFRKNPSIDFDYSEDDLYQATAEDEPTIIRTVGEKEPAAPIVEEELEAEPEETEIKTKKSPWPIILAVLAIVVFVGGIAYFLFSMVFGGGGILSDTSEEVVVPNLVGMTMEEVSLAQRTGEIDSVFEIVQGELVTNDAPAGQIVSQDPQFNEKKKITSGETVTITVTISTGPEEMVMPNVIGIDYRLAQSTLENSYGVTVVLESEYSSTVSEDMVIRTDPVSGTDLTDGQTVTVVYSLGTETTMITVNSYVNLDIEQAMTLAANQGLYVDNVMEVVSDTAKGTVLDQSIQAGSEVEQGTGITFYVSSGPQEEEGTDDDNLDTEEPEEPEVTTPVASEEPAVTSTKSVSVDLSGYEDNVHVVVTVDGTVQVDSWVDATSSDNSTLTEYVTGSGQQEIVITVNDAEYSRYILDFDS